jgi:hypothetical protein
MFVDRFSGRHTTSSAAAVVAFEAAVLAVAGHRPLGGSLDQCLAHDPHLVAAHALKGLGAVLLGRAETMAAARRLVAASRAALAAVGGGSASERTLVAAHELAAYGHLQAAAERLEDHLTTNPRDLLAAKAAHALRFMSGQPDAMLAGTLRLLPHWSARDPGFGFILGCHAFGLEENGELGRAEEVGRRAIAIEPSDAWGLHAVSHVLEAEGRNDDGIGWLEASRPHWRECNNFAFHMAWHLALFHLANGDHPTVLAIYDHHVRPHPTDDFRDMANAVSMLWRLEQEGVEVADRWGELHAIAWRRRTDTSYVFGSLHYLLALVAAGDIPAAHEMIAALERAAREGRTDQSRVSRDVGLDLAKTIVSMATGHRLRADMASVARRLPAIGGSFAQRDLFLRTLMLMAADAGDTPAANVLESIRLQQRRDDRFSQLVQRRLRGARARRMTLPLMTAATSGHGYARA